MQRIDAEAIETVGIPRVLLMDHAGLAVAHAVQSLIPAPSTILICAGTGFNGGDGLAAARHLHGWGYTLRVLVTGELAQLRPEPAIFARILRQLGVVIEVWDAQRTPALLIRWLVECHGVVDALLGIGMTGQVREPVATVIDAVNQSKKPVVAADVPSGLDADAGIVQGRVIRATTTVAFGLAKHGCTVRHGPAYAGALRVDAITIPPRLLQDSS